MGSDRRLYEAWSYRVVNGSDRCMHAAHWQVSSAMGFGFRCGFLGLLHMEIVQERLEREYDLDLIITAPTVVYKCRRGDGAEMVVDNPCNLPDKHDNLQEPYCRCARDFPTLHSISHACRVVWEDLLCVVLTCAEPLPVLVWAALRMV